MKFVNVLASAAAVAIMASCSCCNNGEAAADAAADSIAAAKADSLQKDSVVKAENKAKRTAAVEAGEAFSEAADTTVNAQKLFGRIAKIDGNNLTVTPRGNRDTAIVVTVPNASEFVEGDPIRVVYTTDENGNNVAAENAHMPRRFRQLIGKWSTEDDKISFELRRRNRMRNTDKKMKNIDYKGWFVPSRDSIEFEFTPKGAQGIFTDAWEIAELDSTHLLLVKKGADGTVQSKYDMHRIDANED